MTVSSFDVIKKLSESWCKIVKYWNHKKNIQSTDNIIHVKILINYFFWNVVDWDYMGENLENIILNFKMLKKVAIQKFQKNCYLRFLFDVLSIKNENTKPL